RVHPVAARRVDGFHRGDRPPRWASGSGPPGTDRRALLPPGIDRRPAAASGIREAGGIVRIRTAGLLDLARIEEMHRSADILLSPAEPPAARLRWLSCSPLSALLPLSQETLIYVAEENGKVVGYIQASGQPLGLDL